MTAPGSGPVPAGGVPALFMAICDLALALEVGNLSALPGVWSYEFGDFVVSINAHPTPRPDPQGLQLQPYHASIHAPKYLAAVLVCSAHDGYGSIGMEDDAIAALVAETDRIKATRP